MAAVSIQVTPHGVRSVVVEQEYIFFIGTSPSNTLNSGADYQRRLNDIQPFLTGGDKHKLLIDLFSSAQNQTIKSLVTSTTSGGMRGVTCPNLRVDLVESETSDGTPLFSIADPHKDISVCRGLIKLLDADWIDIWWTGSLGHAQIKCDRGGQAIWFKGNGQQEVI